MRPSTLNQSMKDMGSSSREIFLDPLKTQAYTWDSKVAIIRKEFVALTGDSDIAVVLNQLLYWSQRVKDYDLLLEEEKSIPYQTLHEEEEQIEEGLGSRSFAQYGWFYKSTPELIEETLLCVSRVTMRRYLNVLLERGWIQERGNSQYKWDRTTHYRVNLYQLDKDLKAIGYGLPGFILEESVIGIDENRQKSSMLKNEPSMVQKSTFECKENHSSLSLTDENPQKSSMLKNEPSMVQKSTLECKENRSSLPLADENRQKSSMSKIEPSMVQKSTFECKESEHSSVKKCTFITENKTESTNREHTQKARAHEDKNFYEENFSSEVLEIWNYCLSQGGLVPMGATPEFTPAHLTDERRRKIYSLLPLYFENDLERWKQLCERVAHSPFLMGHGARRWRVSLDWILVEENLLKVLEGNFDNPVSLEQKQSEMSQTSKEQEIRSVLDAISDPIWKKWCSQLDFSFESHSYVSLWELKSIANAQFLKIEDDRLAWVGSQDTQVLSRIEGLRLKLLPLVQRTFPTVRNVRTRPIGREALHQPESALLCSSKSKFTQQRGENDVE